MVEEGRNTTESFPDINITGLALSWGWFFTNVFQWHPFPKETKSCNQTECVSLGQAWTVSILERRGCFLPCSYIACFHICSIPSMDNLFPSFTHCNSKKVLLVNFLIAGDQPEAHTTWLWRDPSNMRAAENHVVLPMCLCLSPPSRSWAPACCSTNSEVTLCSTVFCSNNDKPCRENYYHWHLTHSQGWLELLLARPIAIVIQSQRPGRALEWSGCVWTVFPGSPASLWAHVLAVDDGYQTSVVRLPAPNHEKLHNLCQMFTHSLKSPDFPISHTQSNSGLSYPYFTECSLCLL